MATVSFIYRSLTFLPLCDVHLHVLQPDWLGAAVFSSLCSLIHLFTLRSTCIRRWEKWHPADWQAGCDLSPPNLSSMLIINPTYSALPVSLHRKLTFLFFSLPLPPLCPFPFTPLPLYRPLFFSVLQQIYSRESYWRWGVWEKQELLPGTGRASHGRHESAERCSTDLSVVTFCLLLSHFVCVFPLAVAGLTFSRGLFVTSLSTLFTWTLTLLNLPPTAAATTLHFYTAVHMRTFVFILHLMQMIIMTVLPDFFRLNKRTTHSLDVIFYVLHRTCCHYYIKTYFM